MRTGAAPLAALAALLFTVSATPAAETVPLPRANPLAVAAPPPAAAVTAVAGPTGAATPSPSKPTRRSTDPATDGPAEAKAARRDAPMPGDASLDPPKADPSHAAPLRFRAPRPGLTVPRANPRRPSAPADADAPTAASPIGPTPTEPAPTVDEPSAAQAPDHAFLPPVEGLATPRPNPRRLASPDATQAAARPASIAVAPERTPRSGAAAETRPHRDAPTRLAALTTLEPRPRPRAPPKSAGRPPASAGDARRSEESRLLLLGVYQGPGGRRALIRLADGAVRRVGPGGTIGRWRVSDIGPDSVRLATADRFRTLQLP